MVEYTRSEHYNISLSCIIPGNLHFRQFFIGSYSFNGLQFVSGFQQIIKFIPEALFALQGRRSPAAVTQVELNM